MSIFDWTNTYSYDFYTPAHLVQIAIAVCTIIAAGFLFYKRKNLEKFMYIFFAISTNLIVIVSLIYSIITDTYHLEWYLPLHICNLFTIISVLCCIFKNKVRNFLNNYTVYCGICGCLIGILIPVSTLYYFPAQSFISTIVWIYHLIIGVMGVYLVTSGVFKLKLYNCWKAFVILIPLAVCAIIVNNIFNTNFIGLNRFKPVAGLSIIADLTGEYYALTLISFVVGLGIIVTAVTAPINAYKIKLFKRLKVAFFRLTSEQKIKFEQFTQKYLNASWQKMPNISIKKLKFAYARINLNVN